MDPDEKFMMMAIEEALIGIRSGHGGPFGCVITRDGEIVGKGHNRVLVDLDPTAHGEIVAIRRACAALGTIDLSDCTLYTSSEPCPMCRAAISWAGLGRVVYAASVREAEDVLGFKDHMMAEAFRKGEGMVESEHLHVEGYLEPFLEYKEMQGRIYRPSIPSRRRILHYDDRHPGLRFPCQGDRSPSSFP